MTRSLLAGGTALALATAARAQITRSGAGYLFRLKIAKSEGLYDMTTSLAGAADGELRFAAPVVVSMSGGGSCTIRTGPTVLNGAPVFQALTEKVQLDALGHASASGSVAFLTAQFPAAPVAVGGTWAAPMIENGLSHGKVTYRFVGFENVGKTRCVKLLADLGAGGGGTLYLDPSDGFPVKCVVGIRRRPAGATRDLITHVTLLRK